MQLSKNFTKLSYSSIPSRHSLSLSIAKFPEVGIFPDSGSHFLTAPTHWLQVKLDSGPILPPLQTLPDVSPSVLFISLDSCYPELSLSSLRPSCSMWREKPSSGVWLTLKTSLSPASNGHSVVPSRPFTFPPWPQFPKKTILYLVSRKPPLFLPPLSDDDKIEKLSSL